MKAKEIWIAVNPADEKEVHIRWHEPKYSDCMMDDTSLVEYKKYVLIEVDQA